MFGSMPSSMALRVGVFMSQSTSSLHILRIRDIWINLGRGGREGGEGGEGGEGEGGGGGRKIRNSPLTNSSRTSLI